jgi:hypothetical protein
MQLSRDERFEHAVALLAGEALDWRAFSHSVEGFDTYLKALGVRYFSGREMVTPRWPDLAARLGYAAFLPRHEWFPRGAALALVADKCRRAAAGPVSCRNWWRPEAYDSQVASGNPLGDHPHACAVDLDYRDEGACQRAIATLEKLDDSGLLRMSLGLGKRTTHVGMFSPLGPRRWTY